MPLKICVFEAPKLVTTKTLLLKHYYRRQGLSPSKNGKQCFINGIFSRGKSVEASRSTTEKVF